MNKPVRTPLNEEQLADAKRLSEIYKLRVRQAKERKDSPLNQMEVGERCGWNSPQSTVSQYMTGKVALNLDALVKLSRALDFEPYEVSPTLASGIRRASPGHPKGDAPKDAANTPFPAGDDAGVIDDRYAFIPQYDARAAAGVGHDNPHVEVKSTLAFKRDWLRLKGANPTTLIVIYADGESMWPTIDHHDVLLLDTSKTDPVDGHVFVLASNDKGTIVKRLIKRGDSWIIQSDNPDGNKYPDIVLPDGEIYEHRIVGRVIWRGGDL
ncbi:MULTISPECIES: S24 family peptidase [unclassified Pseudomonas]|uniref:XRE family transcriptional regulator n=1 Tax=unclassified Pseudomonas TaxID=196821 RepID=UPI000C87C367|nr:MULTISPECIES: S24 family peptidase [unclassified Pseudomonas]PMU87098.1 cI repressor protein [Pseudomonas sp. GW704-F3]PMU91428.1 cI repressor protein [Pseudomonas sp. GW704-F5]PMV01228.1 cI repressor protein [Pseudomonas sp. MPBD4-3]PMV25772.1 cI repressor protein [Pseudomonas sp. GW704-F2]